MPEIPAPSKSTPSVVDFVNSSAAPLYTGPMLALKSFIENLSIVFIIGLILAFFMTFRADFSKIQLSKDLPAFAAYPKYYLTFALYGFKTAATCVAWLMIINEQGADDFFNQAILSNSIDDHTYLIRTAAGIVIIFITFFSAKRETPITDAADNSQR